MKYTIVWLDGEEVFEMGGKRVAFVGEHLETIAADNNIFHRASSELHLLCIIREYGIEVDILEEDGSEVVW